MLEAIERPFQRQTTVTNHIYSMIAYWSICSLQKIAKKLNTFYNYLQTMFYIYKLLQEEVFPAPAACCRAANYRTFQEQTHFSRTFQVLEILQTQFYDFLLVVASSCLQLIVGITNL